MTNLTEITQFFNTVYDSDSKFIINDAVLYNKLARLPDEDNKAMSTQELQVFAAYIGKEINSLHYGEIIGFFRTESDEIYRFTYKIHRPCQKNPKYSGEMKTVEKITKITLPGAVFGVDYTAKPYGRRAFYMSLDDLEDCNDKDSLELKKLMDSVAKYSKEHNYCNHFHKIEQQKENEPYIRVHTL